MSGLTMHLFGRPRVVLAPDVLVRFPTHKAQDLFCYLVLGRTHWHSRDALAGQFWADLPERQARKALRTTLWRVRALLENGRRGEGEYMMVESDEICFNAASEYWLDVQEFEHCISAARSSQTGSEDAEFSSLEPLTRAVELYQGDLMQGCYEDWCLYERERQREMYLGALGKLTALHHASGSYEEALRCGLRILSYDPLLEEVQREVMRLHCLAGNRAAAVRQYQLCRAALAKELAIEPMEETTALYAQICRGESIQDPAMAVRRARVKPNPPHPVRREALYSCRRASTKRSAICGGRKRSWITWVHA